LKRRNAQICADIMKGRCKMKLKKFLALSVSAVLAMTALTACGSKDDSSEAASESTSSKKTAKVIEIDLTDEQYAFGVDKDQPELLTQVNDFIKSMNEDGSFEEICNHYFGDGEPVAVESAKLDANKDQLVVATNAAFEPFEYTKGENYYGVDMEIAKALADKLGKELVIQNMDFDAVCLSVGQHKCDIAMAGLTIKPDREEYVSFSDSYYKASQKLIVTSDNAEFDECKTADDVNKILQAKGSDMKIGFQTGTTGQFYCEGDADWGFTKLAMTSTGYKNGSLAVQDLLNGNLNYVIIDAAPAASITAALNAMQ
jgi:ABC-type amino acid transport substrate-binding protein